MKQYTIYCTEEQAKKALELGAPITTYSMHAYGYDNTPKYIYKNEYNIEVFSYCPTVEQMIGWLEEQGFEFYTYKPIDTWIVDVTIDDFVKTTKECATRKEAILAAIDKALALI